MFPVLITVVLRGDGNAPVAVSTNVVTFNSTPDADAAIRALETTYAGPGITRIATRLYFNGPCNVPNYGG